MGIQRVAYMQRIVDARRQIFDHLVGIRQRIRIDCTIECVQCSAALDAFDRAIDPDSLPDSDQMVEDLTPCINDSLHVCNALDAHLKTENPVLLKDIQRQYREAIWPWFGKSWFMQRALDK